MTDITAPARTADAIDAALIAQAVQDIERHLTTTAQAMPQAEPAMLERDKLARQLGRLEATLTIVRRISAAMGETIEAESRTVRSTADKINSR